MKNIPNTQLDENMLKYLTDNFGEKNVSVSNTDRAAYSRDLWPLSTIWMLHENRMPYPPDAIVWAENEEQIAKLLKLANEKKFPIIAYGAGSGVCGGTLPLYGGVILDIKKMDKIVEINDKSLTVRVQTGIIGQHLEHELNHKGYTMGHFPSSIYCSTVGGYLAARSAGQLSTKYGKIEDMVLSLRVVLADGTIVETTSTPRSATGPNFTQLFVGSEGTLGIITEAVLKIYPLPESRIFRGVLFKDIASGIEAIRRIMRSGVTPAAVRLYDELDTILVGAKKEESVEAPIQYEPEEEKEDLVKKVTHKIFDGLQNILLGMPGVAGKLAESLHGKCLLIITFEGDSKLTETELKIALEECAKAGGEDKGEEPGRRWWENRYNVSYNMSKVFWRGSFTDTIDVAATWDKIEPLYHAVRKAVSPYGLIMAHFSHAYIHGCSIYFTVISRGRSEEDAAKRYKKIWDAALAVCADFGATVSHHHGIGLSKAQWLKKELGGLMDVYRSLKQVLDPNNILNPGKMGLTEEEIDIAALTSKK
ncbi:MAG: FAD-binding oxidoreductase [bacterium]